MSCKFYDSHSVFMDIIHVTVFSSVYRVLERGLQPCRGLKITKYYPKKIICSQNRVGGPDALPSPPRNMPMVIIFKSTLHDKLLMEGLTVW